MLLYYPIHDQWAEQGGGLLRHFDGGLEEGFEGTTLKRAADHMVEQGYSFDFISDRQLADISYSDGELSGQGQSYQTIVVPQSQFIPLESLEKLINLAQNGAEIVLLGGVPEGVPGLAELENRQEQYQKLIDQLQFSQVSSMNVASVGDGRILRGDELDPLLESVGVFREQMVDQGLQYVRRSYEHGHTYFITNWGEERVDAWIPLTKSASSGVIYDPMQQNAGVAQVRSTNEEGSEVYLQIDAEESIILRTSNGSWNGPAHEYTEQAGEPVELSGEWTISFTKGGPELPSEITTDTLGSWTNYGEAYQHFSGTGSYRIEFDRPADHQGDWNLNLGDVQESATVYLNGEKLGTAIGPVFDLHIDSEQLQDQNMLEVEVANSMANRIIWMEQEGMTYKKFYNVNFPAYLGQNRNEMGLFDPSGWDPMASGLMGPVTLTPVNEKSWE
ncbi:MAG: glycosyl hydrolase [Balneolaceae bacterium]|nr:glycosyl hydrolase [Balneolaceae bacterium]